jgi:hypothetical protein
LRDGTRSHSRESLACKAKTTGPADENSRLRSKIVAKKMDGNIDIPVRPYRKDGGSYRNLPPTPLVTGDTGDTGNGFLLPVPQARGTI